MDVSVIILNYNTFKLTSNCINSIIEYTKGLDYEIVLVDNASTEIDATAFLKDHPSIKLVKNTVNAGFAAGNNLGIENASGEYILLLNSDTLLTENSISLAVNFAKQQSSLGVLGCRMTYPGGQIQYTARKFRSISCELLDLFPLIPWMMSYKRRSRRMLGKYFRHNEVIQADWLNGAFFLFRKELLDSMVGKKLDDRFFMYGEDQLWCEQIKKMGKQNIFFSGTTIIHINSGSTSHAKQLQLRKIMMKHELEIMRERKGRDLYYFVFKLIYASKESFRNFIKWIYFKVTGKTMR